MLKNDTRERPNATLCVGLKWDFPSDFLINIAVAMGGSGLSIVMEIVAKNYGRVGGFPDLWYLFLFINNATHFICLVSIIPLKTQPCL